MVYSIADSKELSLSLCSDSMGVHAHKARAVSNMTAYQMQTRGYIFFQGLFFIIFSYIWSFMVVWGLGLWCWGPRLGFWGWDFQLMGFGFCGVGPSKFFGFGLFI